MSWYFFGEKTRSVLDVWSAEHVLSGVSCGQALRKLPIKQALLCLGLIAFAWESVEHYLEEGLAGRAVEYWFHGVEFWANRLIADPLMMLIGYWVARKWSVLAWPARAMSLAWLVLNIFVFPHSMYIHEWLGR